MTVERSQRMTRRRLLQALAAGASALGAASLLGACGQDAPSADSARPTAALPEAPAATVSPQNTITVWYYDDSLVKAVDAFKRAHPTVGVDLKQFGDADQGLLRALESGAGLPDVSVFFSGNAGAIAQRGGLHDLSMAPFDAAALKSDIVSAAWDGGLSVEGKLIGMPLSVYPGTYWYRADLLDAAGVESDPAKLEQRITDWPSLFQFAKEYTAKQEGVSLLPRVVFDVFFPQLTQLGGGLVEKSKLLIEEKGVAPAQQMLLARTLALDLPLVDSGGAWQEAMRNGKIAGLFAPTSFQGYISNIHSNQVGKWRSIAPPGGAFLQGAQYLGIPTASTRPEIAWEFVKYCCASVEGQNLLLSTSGDFPALRTAWSDPLYDAPVGFFGEQRVYRAWANIAQSAQMLRSSPYDSAIFDALTIALRKVLDKERDPVAALQDVEQQIKTANPELST